MASLLRFALSWRRTLFNVFCMVDRIGQQLNLINGGSRSRELYHPELAELPPPRWLYGNKNAYVARSRLRIARGKLAVHEGALSALPIPVSPIAFSATKCRSATPNPRRAWACVR